MRTLGVVITVQTDEVDDDQVIADLADIIRDAFARAGVHAWRGVIVPPDVNT